MTSSRGRSDDGVHGFQSVQEQVEHHLLQLHPVAEHAREIPGELGPQSRACPPRFGLGQGDHLANDVIDVQRLLLGRRSAREGSNPRDHVAGPPAVAGDGLQAVAHFVEIRRRTGQEAQAGVRVDDDARERLVDLVSDGRGHLSQRRDAATCASSACALRDGLFCLLPLGDVVIRLECRDAAGPARLAAQTTGSPRSRPRHPAWCGRAPLPSGLSGAICC